MVTALAPEMVTVTVTEMVTVTALVTVPEMVASPPG